MALLPPRAGTIVFSTKHETTYVLLVKYNLSKDVYDIPRGHIEKGEKPLTTAIRELKEETGIDCKPTYRVGTYEFATKNRNSGTLLHYLIYLYSCVISYRPLKVLDKKEVEKAIWVPLDKAFKLITNKDLIKFITQSFLYFHRKQKI